MAFSDLVKDIIDTSRERIKNPFTGAFIIAFLIYNRKPILYFLLSYDTVENRIDVLTEDYSLDYTSFGIPLLIAVGYLILIPIINLGISWLLTKPKKKAVEISYEEKNDKAGKERELQNKIAGNEEIENLNKRIENLTKENSNLQNTINNLEERNNTQTNKLNSMIEELNNEIQKSESKIRDLERFKFVEEAAVTKTEEDAQDLYIKIGVKGAQFLKDFPSNGYSNKIVHDNDRLGYLRYLRREGFVERLESGKTVLTNKGKSCQEYLKKYF